MIEVATGRQYSYRAFEHHTLQGASLLVEHGIGRGDRVALSLPNCVELASLYFSCYWLGAVAVPIRPEDPADEVAAALDQAQPDLAVADPEVAPSVCRYVSDQNHDLLEMTPGRRTDTEQLSLDEWRLGGNDRVCPEPIEPREPEEDNLLSITFTSGTTSVPKGVAHRTSSLLGNANAFNRHMGFGPNYRFYHVMRMTYMAGWLNVLLAPFAAGASVVLGRAFDAKTSLTFWEPVIEHGVNAFWVAPAMLEALLRVDRSGRGRKYCRDNVDAICVGTAPLGSETREKFEAQYETELLESYGLSELLIISATRPNSTSSGGTGRILEEVDVRVINGGKGERETGEIVVRTPHRMVGYLNPDSGEPESTPEWFKTGDLGRVDASGNLHVVGRKKDLIIRGGVNISPRSVEERIREHPDVAEVAVIGVEERLYGEEVVAAVVPANGKEREALVEEIRAHCSSGLRKEAVPGRITFVKSVPRSRTTGEVQRERLREQVKGKDEDSSEGG